MKSTLNKSIVIIILSCLINLNMSANESGNPKSISISDANKIIKEHVTFPNLLLNLNQQEKVNVVFTVNEIGQVNLAIANTANDKLKKSIESQFLKLKISNLKANNAYSVVLNFKAI